MPTALLINLGTPAAPTPSALRAYLAEFLADRRVVDLPRALWLPILHGIILRTRPAKSAAKYAKIWTPQGSPLAAHTQAQANALQAWFTQRGLAIKVLWAMRYGQPAIAATLDALNSHRVPHGQPMDPLVVLPLYPQFSFSTTASSFDALAAWVKRQTAPPRLRRIDDYHTDPGYIEALAQGIKEHRQHQGAGEALLMSFHGIPQRAVERGDPYARQCQTSAHLLAEALQLSANEWRLTYQSRFGAGRWLQPATLTTLTQLAQAGVKSVDVVCPGFAADCLETLEEINIECRAAFLAAGGARFNYIPCLNDHPAWVAALGEMVLRTLNF